MEMTDTQINTALGFGVFGSAVFAIVFVVIAGGFIVDLADFAGFL